MSITLATTDSPVGDQPFPIARPLSRLLMARRRGDPKQLALISELVEAYLRLTAAILISGVLEAPQNKNDDEIGAMLCRPQSGGDLLNICRRAAKALSSDAHPLARRAQEALATTNGRQSSLQKSFDELVRQRNRLGGHHGAVPTDREAVDASNRMWPILVHVIDQMGFLSEIEIASLYEIVGDDLYGVRVWRGSRAPDILPVDRHISLFPNPDVGAVYAISEDATPLLLSPLAEVVEDELEERLTYLLMDHVVMRSKRLHSARYRSVEGGEPLTLDGTSHQGLSLGRLSPLMKSEGPRRGARTSATSYYQKTQKILVKRLSELYVPRENLDNALTDLLSNQESGVLVVEGEAGAGKSCWLAHVVEQHEAIHHFFSRSAGRDRLAEMLRSVMEQMNMRYGLNIDLTQNAGELPGNLANALIDVSVAQPGPLLICIDAVDEISLSDAASAWAFIPSEIPAGVFFVATTRRGASPQSPLRAMTARIGSLSFGDARRLASRHGFTVEPAELENALAVSEGNPLMLVWGLSWLRQHPNQRLLPGAGASMLFGAALERMLAEDHDHLASRLLALLAVQREPLPLHLVARVLEVRKLEVVDVVRRSGGLVNVIEGRLALAHATVAAYMSDETQPLTPEATELLDAHQALARLDDLGPDGREYFKQHAIHHLLAIGAEPEVGRLAGREPFTQAVVAAVIERVRSNAEAAAQNIVNAVASAAGARTADDVVRRVLEGLVDYGLTDLEARLREPDSIGKVLTTTSRSLVLLKESRHCGRPADVVELANKLLSDDALEPGAEPRVRLLLADGLRESGHHEQALTQYQMASRSLDKQVHPIWHLQAEFAIADMEYVYGDLRAAETRLLILQEFVVGAALWSASGQIQRELGHIDFLRGAAAQATARYEAALEYAERSRQTIRLAQVHNSLAESTAAAELDRAFDHVRLGRLHAGKSGFAVEEAKSIYIQAHLELLSGDFVRGRNTGEQALSRLREVGYESGVARSHLVLAEACLACGDNDAALEHAIASLKYFVRECIYPSIRALALRVATSAAEQLSRGDEVQAVDCFDRIPHQEEFQIFERPYSGPLDLFIGSGRPG